MRVSVTSDVHHGAPSLASYGHSRLDADPMTNIRGLLVGACVLVLSGCTAAVDREAAPLASSDALKSNLGSRICVENRSTLPFIGHFEEFDSADPDGAMPPGAVICAEGTRVVGADVVGSLVFSDWSRGTIVRHDYNVSNPWLGEPFVTLFQNNTKQIPNEKIVIGFKCVSDKGLAEGESRTWDNGILAFTVKRLRDTGWKEFRLELTDSADPVAGYSPQARKCSQGYYPS